MSSAAQRGKANRVKACGDEAAKPVDAHGAVASARNAHVVHCRGVVEEDLVGLDDVRGRVGLAKARRTPAGVRTVAHDRLRNVTGG